MPAAVDGISWRDGLRQPNVHKLVHDARVNGHTWHQIAHALGTNADTAQLRFDPESPIPHSRWPHEH